MPCITLEQCIRLKQVGLTRKGLEELPVEKDGAGTATILSGVPGIGIPPHS